jgi:hypothetical protein
MENLLCYFMKVTASLLLLSAVTAFTPMPAIARGGGMMAAHGMTHGMGPGVVHGRIGGMPAHGTAHFYRGAFDHGEHHPFIEHGKRERGFERHEHSFGLGLYPYYNYYSPYGYGWDNGYDWHGPQYSYREHYYLNDTVADVQRALARFGYYHGAIDGMMGPLTREAIRAFQASHGLAVTGRINRPLERRLGLA